MGSELGPARRLEGKTETSVVMVLTRRQYLELTLCLDTDIPLYQVREAVASVALEHPEWDMDERRTWDEWKAEYGR